LLGASFGLAYNCRLSKANIQPLIDYSGSSLTKSSLNYIVTWEDYVGIFVPLICGTSLERVGNANMLKFQSIASVLG